MKTTLRVLCIGSEASMRTMYLALFGQRECELVTASTYRELCAISGHETFHIAVLNDSLSREEILGAAQLIRTRWPFAKVLVVSTEPPHIDDALYDDCVVPGMPNTLFLAMLRLLKRHVKAVDERCQ